jgi:hypothetical protein
VTEPVPWPAPFPVDPDGVLQFRQHEVDPGGVDLGDGVRLGPAHRQDDTPVTSSYVHRVYRGELEIGGIDYHTCHTCRTVMLGEIGLLDAEQRRGIGTRVLAQQREELPGYRWFITPEKPASRPFWARIRATYPGSTCSAPRQRSRAWASSNRPARR